VLQCVARGAAYTLHAEILNRLLWSNELATPKQNLNMLGKLRILKRWRISPQEIATKFSKGCSSD